MNPETNTEQTPNPILDPPIQPTYQPSSKRVLQPITQNLVIDPEPTRPEVDQAVVTAGPAQITGQPPAGAPAQPTAVPLPVAAADDGVGKWLGVAVTLIGILYIINGVVSLLSGVAGLLSLNTMGLIAIALGFLYIYVGKGLMNHNSNARLIALILSWIVLVGSVISIIFATFVVMNLPQSSDPIFKLVVFVPPVMFLLSEIAIIFVLTRPAVAKLFRVR